MAGPNCHNCIYSVCDPELWLRLMSADEPILPRCANHPLWPAQLHEVPGVPCKNYRRKPIAPDGDVRLIPLADGLYAYVDAADYEWLSQWDWHSASGGYPARRENGRTIFMHREIMPPPPNMVVDHQDGNKANNCRCNLRVCTPQENRCNAPRKSRGRCQFRGVYREKRRGRICSRIKCNGKYYWLGRFPTEVEAARAYDRAAVEAFGEFARPNFPEEWPPERRRELHAQYLRTGKLSFARTPVIPQRAKGKKIRRKERKRDTHKAKAKGNKKKAKASRKAHPARRKTNKLPQSARRTQSRRNHRHRPERSRRMDADEGGLAPNHKS